MVFEEPARTTDARRRHLGITAYGCEPDEADLFHELAPRRGVALTTIADAVSDAGVILATGNRCVSVGHRSAVSGRELRALKDAGVEYVSTRSIGLDHIDLEAAAALGITVENVVYPPDGVADFTLMLMLMAIRNVTGLMVPATRHGVDPVIARGSDLCDMTVGVLGVGRIGRAVITRLQGFGCRVLECSNGREPAAAAEFVALDDLLRGSDIVTLHLPLNAGTHHLIGREQIAAMKPGAFLINTGRGALVDTGALIAAMESGHLGGVALDVLEGEDGRFPCGRAAGPLDDPFPARLRRLPNAVVTPHIAYRTRRTLHEVVERTLTNCLIFEGNRTHAEAQGRDPVRGMLRGA